MIQLCMLLRAGLTRPPEIYPHVSRDLTHFYITLSHIYTHTCTQKALPASFGVKKPYGFSNIMVSGAGTDVAVHMQLPTDKARSLSVSSLIHVLFLF